MRPDLIIEVDGKPVGVADCKYKKAESESYKNHDFYQVLAYCIAKRVRRGLLIYPLAGEPLDGSVSVLNTNITIGQSAINLGLPFFEFRKECDRFAEEVFAWGRLLLTCSPLSVQSWV